MSRNYSITEPHPHVPATTSYIHAGRGGAGNVTYINPANLTKGSNAQGPASATKLQPPSPSSYYTSGRGGAGNMRIEKERAIFSFDEELERQRKVMDNQAPYYHVGRGGAGNLVDEANPARRTSNSSNGSTYSASGSVRRSMEASLNKFRGSFSRN